MHMAPSVDAFTSIITGDCLCTIECNSGKNAHPVYLICGAEKSEWNFTTIDKIYGINNACYIDIIV